MVMQTELADYAHKFENLLDRVRSGEIICTPEMATLLLDALDGLNSFMDRIRGTGDLNQELIDRTLKQIGVFESDELLLQVLLTSKNQNRNLSKTRHLQKIHYKTKKQRHQKVKNSLHGMMKRKTKKGIFLI